MSPPEEICRCRIGTTPENMVEMPINEDSQPMFIDTEHAAVHVVFRSKDWKHSSSNSYSPMEIPYFSKHKNRKRVMSVQFSVRFKKEYAANDIVFGTHLKEKVNLPFSSVLKAMVAFAKMIDPTLLCEITAERVLWFNKSLNVMNWVLAEEATAPLVKSIPGTTTIRKSLLPAAAAATTSSSGSSDENDKAMLQPCNQPQLEHQIGRWRWGGHLPELDEGSNDRLFPDGKARDDSQRKRYFRQKANGDQFVFKPENVYHFELYNPTTDVNTWKCDMGPLVSLDLRKYMLSNPLPFTLKSESEGTIFFSVEFDWIKTPKSE